MVKHTFIRVILSMVAKLDLELEQMDVRTAFLHRELDERILMHQPKGFIKREDEEKVCLLKNNCIDSSSHQGNGTENSMTL